MSLYIFQELGPDPKEWAKVEQKYFSWKNRQLVKVMLKWQSDKPTEVAYYFHSFICFIRSKYVDVLLQIENKL